MRMTIDVDCTPEEARRFFGLPDVSSVNDMITDAMKKRAEENLDSLSDPEQLMKSFVHAGERGFEQFQTMMAGAMASGSSAHKEKK